MQINKNTRSSGRPAMRFAVSCIFIPIMITTLSYVMSHCSDGLPLLMVACFSRSLLKQPMRGFHRHS
ncbi:hypothetical protein CLOSTHATH_00282 [Hungatella hathewayi DSM 13479]|uniref:Uncharacterized protein n=1 Tax=Hungatella hathewayi DSM 13479 TaxID=566550 RepID=D3A9L1_9FIRM|nr:hypothetical protein CLOSTHATH_00282 [Hungatella hathewayi DSM 13479]